MPLEGYTAREIAGRIPGAREVSGGFRAPCIAHGGDGLNLSIRDSPDGAVVTCHSHGCSIADIKAALGLDTDDRRKNGASNGAGRTSIYPYHDATGTLLYEILVTRFPNKDKDSNARRPHPSEPGEYLDNLKGVPRVLYHLQQLNKAIANKETILIVEGEKCVHAAESLGYAATTNPFGSGKWRDEYTETLRGVDVVILPDNDEPGRKHADKVISALQGVAKSIKRIELPGLPDKGDIADWIDTGGTREKLDKLIADAPCIGDEASNDNPLGIETLAEFMSSHVEMPEGIVEEIAYPGAITSIAAPRGSTKSIITHIMAKELASGGVIRGQKVDKARVLIIDSDNPQSIVQRYLSNICDDYNIDLHLLTRDKVKPLLDKAFWQSIPAEGYDMVILDSFGGMTPGISEAEGAKLQQAMDTIRRLADRGPAVLILDNTNKAADSYRGRGEKLDRIDIAYECRDVTGWTPSGPDWWADLPDMSDASWQDRASRHQDARQRRLAFIATKFRFGLEPEPFVVEVDFDADPWSCRDVTEAIKELGDSAYKQKKINHAAKQYQAVEALVQEIKRRDESGAEVIGKREAENFMYNVEPGAIKKREAHNLLESHDAELYPDDGRWRIKPIPNARGQKQGVYPLSPREKKSEPNNTPDTKPLNLQHLENADLVQPQKAYLNQIPTFEDQQNQCVTDAVFGSSDFDHAENSTDLGQCDPNTQNGVNQIGSKMPEPNSAACNPNKINGQNRQYLVQPGKMGLSQISQKEDEQNQQVTKSLLFGSSNSNLDDADDMDLMVGSPKWARPANEQRVCEPKESPVESDPSVSACVMCGGDYGLSQSTGKCKACVEMERFYDSSESIGLKDIGKVNMICEWTPELIDDVVGGKMKLVDAYREAKSRGKQTMEYMGMSEGHEEVFALMNRDRKNRIAYFRNKTERTKS